MTTGFKCEAPPTFRDREFDSHIRADLCRAPVRAIDAALRGQYTLDRAADFTVNAQGETRVSAIERKATDIFLATFYRGRGEIDYDAAVAAVERSKGAPLVWDELHAFARLAGDFAGRVLAKEVNAEVEAAIADGFSQEYVERIIVRGLRNAWRTS